MAIKAVEEEEYGVYIWITEDGSRVADEENRTMNIPSKKGDIEKIKALRDAARYYGIEGGKPLFLPGRRRVTDSEHEYQNERLRAGLVPDPLDFKAMEEEQKYARKFGL